MRIATQLDAGKVQALYVSGLTQREIAEQLGVTQKIVFGFMRRHGMTPRKAAPRDQSGGANPNWRGERIGYKAAHDRVSAVRGKPCNCEHCGTTDPEKRYHWANLTKQFHNPNDYIRLCISCHRKFDHAIANTRKEEQ